MSFIYQVFKSENQRPSPVSHCHSLHEAKSLGEEIAQRNSHVWIECWPLNFDPKKPIPMNGFRFDKDINLWIETPLPICSGELY